MISILAENINNIYIMEDSELASITEEETMELLSLLPSATTEDKNHIKHIKNYIQKAKNNYINLTK